MKDAGKYLLYITTYTFVYHGLYYCPPIYNKFTKFILFFHGK